MDYIVYTNEGFAYTESGRNIENSQILDFFYDVNLSQQECIKKYMDENPIEEADFNRHELRVAIRINEKICVSVKQLLLAIRQSGCKFKDESTREHIKVLESYFNL